MCQIGGETCDGGLTPNALMVVCCLGSCSGPCVVCRSLHWTMCRW